MNYRRIPARPDDSGREPFGHTKPDPEQRAREEWLAKFWVLVDSGKSEYDAALSLGRWL